MAKDFFSQFFWYASLNHANLFYFYEKVIIAIFVKNILEGGEIVFAEFELSTFFGNTRAAKICAELVRKSRG